ncbi:MAG: glycosyltransferase [Chloroflexota bacterium]
MTGPAAAPVSGRLRVGYLHLGRAESGVRRYGRIIAETAAHRSDVQVVESDAGGRDARAEDIRRAVRRLRDTDVIHLQWKLADWGGARWALPHLEVALQACRRPVVVTLHDVYERPTWQERWLEPTALGIRRLAFRSRTLVVHSAEERRRLSPLVAPSRMSIVPHFVEARPPLPDRDAAKAQLGLAGRPVITLQGFMTKRKGHRLVLEALRTLPPEVFAIFAGSPIEGREARGDELARSALELGVSERVRFTGYVPDAELTTIMAATDVALCPFREMSASGSVSTWISTGRPIVTSGLPQFREYEALSPGAMRIVDPLTAEGLAERIRHTLAEAPPVDPAVQRLAGLLAAPRAVARYLDVYRIAAKGG